MQLTNEDVILIRKGFSMSMREFGEIAGIDASQICRIELGQSRVSAKTSRKICEKFELTELTLMKIRVFYADLLR